MGRSDAETRGGGTRRRGDWANGRRGDAETRRCCVACLSLSLCLRVSPLRVAASLLSASPLRPFPFRSFPSLSHPKQCIDGQLIEAFVSEALGGKRHPVKSARVQLGRILFAVSPELLGLRVLFFDLGKNRFDFRVRVPSASLVL